VIAELIAATKMYAESMVANGDAAYSLVADALPPIPNVLAHAGETVEIESSNSFKVVGDGVYGYFVGNNKKKKPLAGSHADKIIGRRIVAINGVPIVGICQLDDEATLRKQFGYKTPLAPPCKLQLVRDPCLFAAFESKTQPPPCAGYSQHPRHGSENSKVFTVGGSGGGSGDIGEHQGAGADCGGRSDTQSTCLTSVGKTGLYFGPVENFAGQERPYVVVTGMQHPRYLVYRLKRESGTETNWGTLEDRVDSRAYLAVTRCTFQLSVVEVDVEQFGFHFSLSPSLAGKSDVVSIKGQNWTKAQSSLAAVEYSGKTVGRCDGSGYEVACDSRGAAGMGLLRLQTRIDFAAPRKIPIGAISASVMNFHFQLPASVGMPGLKRSLDVMCWDRFAANVGEFDMGYSELAKRGLDVSSCNHLDQRSTPPFKLLRPDSCRAVLDVLLGSMCKLQYLFLTGNGLSALAGASTLAVLATNLVELHLENNNLHTLPDELGMLKTLHVLDVGYNPLSEISASLFCNESTREPRLPSLKYFNCEHCGLTALPKEIGLLSQLTVLRADSNELAAVPDEIGMLAMLKKLRLDCNQLTELTFLQDDDSSFGGIALTPPCTGSRGLPKLEYLHVSHNRLAAIPLGGVERLERIHNRIWLDKNCLSEADRDMILGIARNYPDRPADWVKA
jgi:hypothetical protein